MTCLVSSVTGQFLRSSQSVLLRYRRTSFAGSINSHVSGSSTTSLGALATEIVKRCVARVISTLVTRIGVAALSSSTATPSGKR